MVNTSRAFRVSPPVAISILVLAALLVSACSVVKGDSWAGVTKDPNNGMVFVSNGKRVVAVDYASGDLLWEYPDKDNRDAKFFALPVVDGDTIYVGDYKGQLHAIDRLSGVGAMIYKPDEETVFGPISETPEDRIISSVALNPDLGIVYFGLGNRDVVALKVTREDGWEVEKLWTFNTDHGVWATPLYVPAYNPEEEIAPSPEPEETPSAEDTPSTEDNLAAEDISTGETDESGDQTEPEEPVVFKAREEATLYVTSLDKHLYALDPESGEKRWSKFLDGAAPGTPVHDPVRNWLYVGTFKSEVLAIDLAPDLSSSERIVDRYSTKGWVWGSPVLKDGVLYIGDLAGYVYALEITDAGFKEKWEPQHIAKDAVRGSPLVLKNLIVVGSQDKHVYLVSKENGEKLWEQKADGKVLTELVYIPKNPEDEESSEQVIVGTSKRDELLIAYKLYKIEGDDVLNVGWTYSDKTKLGEE